MTQEEINSWIDQEIMKLTPKSYLRTYYAVGRIDSSCGSVNVVLPIDIFENKDSKWLDTDSLIGFEIIDSKILASLCPFDMEDAYLTIKGEYTYFKHERIIDLVDHSEQLNGLYETLCRS